VTDHTHLGNRPAPAEQTATPTPTPFPIYSDVEVHNLPDPDWMVEDLFMTESLVALFGSSGEGKTFVSLDLAFSIATGQPFHGREVVSGEVVYVYAEGAPSLKFRVDAWKIENGWAMNETASVWFIPTAVDLAGEDEDELQGLLATIRTRVSSPTLVVVDTLARCFGSADENSTQAMNRFTSRCAAIKEELGCTVLVVHHTGWEGGRERGNKSLRNNFDTVIACSKPTRGPVKLECKKQKDASAFDPVKLTLTEVHLDGGHTSCVLRSGASCESDSIALDDEATTVLNTLGSLGEDGATFSAWKTAVEKDVTESTFKRRRGELIGDGLVTSPPSGKGTRGFRYQVTPKGRAVLKRGEVQNEVDPSSGPPPSPVRSGAVSVPVEIVDGQWDRLGFNSGPNGSMDRSDSSGSGGGAYRAPHEPGAPRCGSAPRAANHAA